MEPSGLQALARIVDPVAQRFVDAGFRIYLVGGVVRDLVLAADGPFDNAANDIDLTTDALPVEIKRLLSPAAEAIWAQGERFGTIGARIDGQALEVTTHRAEAYDPTSRKPSVSFGRELNEDLSRRDFTVNAMAIELPGHSMHDPYGGREDLAAGRLRTPLSPDISFDDDPLRMMRAARFISRFDLSPDPGLVDAAHRLSDRLAIVSVERVADELERLLAVTDPSAGLQFLVDTGVLAQIVQPFGQIIDADGRDDRDPQATAVALAACPGDVVVRRAGLLWPVRAGAKPALAHLRYSKADQTRTKRLIDGLERGLQPGLDAAAVRRIVALVGFEDLPQLLALAANVTAHDRSHPTTQTGAARLISAVAELRQVEDLSDFEPPLSGNEVIDLLGLTPGPEIGKAQAVLREHRLENGPLTAEQARELLISWWERTGKEPE